MHPDRTESPKYPDIQVQFTGEDGNALAIIGAVRKALRRAGADYAELNMFMAEATAGDYDGLLRTVMRWVTVA